MTDATIDDVPDTGDHAVWGSRAPDPTPSPVEPGSEDDVPADPGAVPHDHEDAGPYDADKYGTDSAGRPVNRFGRYEGQAGDEIAQLIIDAQGLNTMPEPNNGYGRRAYERYHATLEVVPMAWDGCDLPHRVAWIMAAKEAIAAYDEYLQGKADRYADAVARVPSFTDQLQAAIEADDAAKISEAGQ